MWSFRDPDYNGKLLSKHVKSTVWKERENLKDD